MSTTITFAQGESVEKRGTVWIQHGTSLNAIRTFAQRLQPYTTASIPAVSYTEHDFVDLPPWGAGEFNSVRVYAHIFLRSRENDTVYGFKLLSPDDSIFDESQEVTVEFGNLFAQWYSDMAGSVFDFEHGALAGVTA